MAVLSRIHSFVALEVPTAAQWNADIDQIINEINGNLDNTNVKLTGATGLVDLASAQTITGVKTFSDDVIITGAYTSPLRLGTRYIWYDSANDVIRTKNSAPSTAVDGYFFQELT